jgi:hypothetical protein
MAAAPAPICAGTAWTCGDAPNAGLRVRPGRLTSATALRGTPKTRLTCPDVARPAPVLFPAPGAASHNGPSAVAVDGVTFGHAIAVDHGVADRPSPHRRSGRQPVGAVPNQKLRPVTLGDDLVAQPQPDLAAGRLNERLRPLEAVTVPRSETSRRAGRLVAAASAATAGIHDDQDDRDDDCDEKQDYDQPAGATPRSRSTGCRQRIPPTLCTVCEQQVVLTRRPSRGTRKEPVAAVKSGRTRRSGSAGFSRPRRGQVG